jgi:hypothetical protein
MMKSSETKDESTVTFCIPRRFMMTMGLGPGRLPELVTQDSVFELFGITPRAYLGFARAGRFPCTKRGRIRIAHYEDVKNYLTTRLARDEAPNAQESSAASSINWEAVMQNTRVGRR